MTNSIDNCDDIIDSRDVIARIEELEERSGKYAAGWNMPGYMPDSEPSEFDNFEEARDSLVGTLEQFADEVEETAEETANDDPIVSKEAEKRAAEFRETITLLEAMPDSEDEVSMYSGPYCFWIKPSEDGLDEDELEELTNLKALADQGEGYGDWDHGETLIRDGYFAEYAEQLADDIGAVDRKANWPLNHIDWEAAADELKQDYMSVEFDGVTYWMRS